VIERDDLDGWVSDGVTDSAAAGRSHEHWLRAASLDAARLGGVILDHGEAGRPILIDTAVGVSVNGSVVTVGPDVVALRRSRGGVVLIALGYVAVVRSEPTARAAIGDRPVVGRATLAGVLAEAAAERPTVQLFVAGGTTVTGELRSVGADVLVLRPETGGTAHVRLGSLAVASFASG
jgi:hypothetical protein